MNTFVYRTNISEYDSYTECIWGFAIYYTLFFIYFTVIDVYEYWNGKGNIEEESIEESD